MECVPGEHPPTAARLRQRRDSRDERFRAIREDLIARSARLQQHVEEIEAELAGLARRGNRSLQRRVTAIIDDLVAGDRREIAIIESALQRMANNEFDCCMTCGATISLDQLSLFPYSVNCRECSVDFPLDCAEKLHAQHLHMRNALNWLAELIESILLGYSRGNESGPDQAAALIVLADLARELPEHFDLEEQDGHLESAIAVAPRFHRHAAGLIAQHGEFTERLGLLLDTAQQAGTSVQGWARVQQDFLRLAADLFEHERAENELIGRAHTEDIGSPG